MYHVLTYFGAAVSPLLQMCVWVSRGCGQRVATSTNITRAKRGFYGHGRQYAVTNRSDHLEVNDVTYFFSHTLEASVPWRTTPFAGIPDKIEFL